MLNELDEHLRIFAWLLSAQHDLMDAYEPETQLMMNTEREKLRIMRKAFIVLEAVYGSRFHAVTLLKSDQSTDARDYLTEICDLLLPENIKNKCCLISTAIRWMKCADVMQIFIRWPR